MAEKLFQQHLGYGVTSSRNSGEVTNLNANAHSVNQPDRNLLWLAANLVQPQQNQQAARTNRDGVPIPDDMDISKIFKAASTSTKDARNILKSSPELCMGIDIYIAGLLSPNDISEPDLNITCPGSIEADPIKSAMLDVIKAWAKDEYKIDTRLKNWVFRAKYLSGAVPLAIVPLTEIDDIINEKDSTKRKLSLESYDSGQYFENNYYKSTGLIGNGRNSSPNRKQSVLQVLKMEDANGGGQTSGGLFSNKVILSEKEKTLLETSKTVNGKKLIEALDNIFIHDNPEVFKLPRIAQAAAHKSITKRFSPLHQLLAMENDSGAENANETQGRRLKIKDGGELVYPNRHFSVNEVASIKPRDIYDNVGHPNIIELPYDSAIPITPPGLPETHLVYLVPLDSTGNPLTAPEEEINYPDSADIGLQTSSGVLGTQMLSQIGDASVDGMSNLRQGVLNNASQRLFNSILEADLKERLKNGIYSGVELDVKLTGVFAELMWKRALAGQQTQFLIIPTELLTYIAFEYNQHGLGESKLAKHRDLAIVASTVQVANALAAINNSISHKKVTISFDDDEIDAFDTDERIKQHIVRAQHANALFSSSNTQDQLNHILNSGFHFTYENGNGNFPGTSFDIEYLNREAAPIDNEYIDGVNRRLIMLSGVSPEIVDMSQEVEFAQTYITGHMLRAQQAVVEQKVLCKNLSKFIRSFALNSQLIIKELIDIVKKAKATPDSPLYNSKTPISEIIEEFIEAIETSLPKPDTTKLKAQMDNLSEHEAFIDKVIEYHFSDPMFSSEEVGEKVGGKLEMLKAVWKTSYMRSVLQSNNLIPQHFKFMYGDVSDDETIDPLIESEGMVKRVADYVIQHEQVLSKVRYKTDAVIERINERDMNAAGSDSEMESNSSTDDTATEPSSDPEPASNEGGGDGGEAPDESGEELFGGDGGDFGFESADHQKPVIRGRTTFNKDK